MGMYVIAFATPKDRRDRVIWKESTYRVGGFDSYIRNEEPFHVPKKTFDDGGYLEDSTAYVMSVERWLEIVEMYRKDFFTETGEAMYVDQMTLWLQTGFEHGMTVHDMEIILRPET